MGKHAQLVIGPAGSGKSTYVDTMSKHCQNSRRIVHCVNLDPAADAFKYDVSFDIRDLISLEDVMEELEYGPNGGLVYCLEYLTENFDWLGDKIDDFGDDYLIFDCPGQVELYTHLPVMTQIVRRLQQWGYQVCVVYCIDALIMSDASRFISGSLMCLSAMIQLELPHINVLTKCDLIQDKKKLEKFLDPHVGDLIGELNETMPEGKHKALNASIGSLLEDYSMVSFLPLDITDEDSIGHVLSHVDHSIQFGEDQEVREPNEGDQDEQAEQREYMGQYMQAYE